MAQVVLQGRRALPKKIMDAGYKFKYQYAADAWRAVFE
jgi:NAD dependent epimerase/dehydratase family enzyme